MIVVASFLRLNLEGLPSHPQWFKGIHRKAVGNSIQAVATALSSVTAQDVIGWFTSCGYNLI